MKTRLKSAVGFRAPQLHVYQCSVSFRYSATSRSKEATRSCNAMLMSKSLLQQARFFK